MTGIIKWPSIGHFRQTVSSVAYYTRRTGTQDENGKPILDESIPLPVLRYRGTVKLHGTNVSLVFNPKGQRLSAQGREVQLSGEHTAFGFYQHVLGNYEVMEALCRTLDKLNSPEISKLFRPGRRPRLVVFGEWCGRGIQGKCAVSQLEKMFVVFRAGWAEELPADVSRDERTFWWLPPDQVKAAVEGLAGAGRIFHVESFPVFDRIVDFNTPETFLVKAVALTTEVENRCPIGAHFGVEGIGEGLVWQCLDNGWEHPRFSFKTKGDKHKGSSHKDKAQADPAEASSIAEFVANTATANRMEQGQSYLEARGIALNQNSMGEFMRWVANDILKEEADLIEAGELDTKKLTKAINKAALGWLRDNKLVVFTAKTEEAEASSPA
jgi:hypothetical protein